MLVGLVVPRSALTKQVSQDVSATGRSLGTSALVGLAGLARFSRVGPDKTSLYHKQHSLYH